MTGASGFVGRHFVRHLREQKEVDVLPLSRSLSFEGLVTIDDYSNAPDGDVLVHLGQCNNRKIVNKHKNSILEAQELLTSLLNKKYKKVVYVSSAAVYSDKERSLQHPEQLAIITDNYSEIKSNSETAVMNSGVGVVARLSNLYGFGMSVETVIGKILDQIPGDGRIKVRDIYPVRDFLWVEDAVIALAKMTIGNKKGIYNIGTGVGTSIGELSQLCLELSGEKHRGVMSEIEHDNFSRLVLNIQDTINDFDWRPEVSLSLGIKRLLSKRSKIFYE